MSNVRQSIEFLDSRSQENHDHGGVDFLYASRMELKTWIRSARKKADLTQEQLGEKLGVTKGNVSAWETGKHEPSYAQIQEIAVITKCPMPDAGTAASAPTIDSKDVQARVQEMLSETGLDAAAFAARLKVPVDRVQSWLAGQPVSVVDAVAIQGEFGYSSPWVLARVGEKMAVVQHNDEFRPKAIGKRKALAVVGMAQLGDNGYWADIEYAVGHGDGCIDWPTSDPDAYALECTGESMRPRIKAGEFVIVEPNHPIQPGDEVMLKSKKGQVMVKEFAYKAQGRVHLLSVNQAFAKISFNEEEVEKMHYVAGIAKPSMWRPG